MEYLKFTWRGVCFFVVPKWFLCTDAANSDTMIVLFSCRIPPRNLSVITECVINMHNLSQLSIYLAAVAFEILLVTLSLLIVMIPRI